MKTKTILTWLDYISLPLSDRIEYASHMIENGFSAEKVGNAILAQDYKARRKNGETKKQIGYTPDPDAPQGGTAGKAISLDAITADPKFNQKRFSNYAANRYKLTHKTEVDPDRFPETAALQVAIDQTKLTIERQLAKQQTDPSIERAINISRAKKMLREMYQDRMSIWLMRTQPRVNRAMPNGIVVYNSIPWEEAYDPTHEMRNQTTGQPTFNFANPDHIKALFDHTDQIITESESEVAENSHYLLDTLQTIMNRTELTESDRLMIQMKVKKIHSREIKRTIKAQYDIDLTENYIASYVYRLYKRIAAEAELIFDEKRLQNEPSAWKECSVCKQKKLRDPRVFVRKAVNRDGLAARCKACDKITRENKKQIQQKPLAVADVLKLEPPSRSADPLLYTRAGKPNKREMTSWYMNNVEDRIIAALAREAKKVKILPLIGDQVIVAETANNQ